MVRRFVLVISSLMILLAGILPGQAQDEFSQDLQRIERATVFVMQTQTISGRPAITCVGSGTIVDRSGLIATNANNTVPNANCPGERLVIALNIRPGESPVPIYYAEIVQANPGLDLALLRITEELNGRQIEPGSLSLPFVELGDSNQVNLDDTISIVGYPDVGNSSAELLRGTVRAFIAEPSGGERSWIKTDASIPGTIAGGGVYNQNGQLIGIPTSVTVRTQADEANCIPLHDTNNDGLINRSDQCVPIGGFINALRPSNFLRPLLRSASLNITVETLTGSTFQFISDAQPQFSNVTISSSVNEGMPSSIVRSLPTGTSSLYVFFDYASMTPETTYEMRVTVNSLPNSTFNLPPVRWSGGTNGMWYIGSSGQVWPDGTYEFSLFIDGLESASTRIVIGGPAIDDPILRNINFGIEAGENLFGIGGVLPTGLIANARFVHRNVPDGIEWTRIWYYNGTEIPGSRVTEGWVNNGQDWKVIRIESGDGSALPPGRYRLDLYLEERLAARSEFIIAGASEGALPRPYQNVRFVTAQSPQDAVRGTSTTSFSGGTRDIYALFDWEQIAPGTLWQLRWSVDGTVFYSQALPWEAPESGENFLMRLVGIDGIPDGTYRMEILVNNARLIDIEMEVGIGQLPIDQFAQTSGVQLSGQIIDSETGQGIPGITFVVIDDRFSVFEFAWRQNQIFTTATSDRNGEFLLDRLLQYDTPYSVIISANGYLPVRSDGVRVTQETDNPLSIVIPLTKD